MATASRDEQPQASSMSTPSGSGEAQRQLDAYAVLDTPPEPEFDDITHVTAAACDVECAVITCASSRFAVPAAR